MLINLEREHQFALRRRFRRETELIPIDGLSEFSSRRFAYQGGPVLVGGDELDSFVLRCIGTVVELEDHQRAGGSIVLQYADGGSRALHLDTSRDGGMIPPHYAPVRPAPIVRRTERRVRLRDRFRRRSR